VCMVNIIIGGNYEPGCFIDFGHSQRLSAQFVEFFLFFFHSPRFCDVLLL